MTYELTSKDSFPKFSFTPVSVTGEDSRKKSDSHYLRSSLKDNCIFKLEDESTKSKQEKAIDELRSQILALTKKVFINQEEIAKMKQKKDKDKKWQTL